MSACDKSLLGLKQEQIASILFLRARTVLLCGVGLGSEKNSFISELRMLNLYGSSLSIPSFVDLVDMKESEIEWYVEMVGAWIRSGLRTGGVVIEEKVSEGAGNRSRVEEDCNPENELRK